MKLIVLALAFVLLSPLRGLAAVHTYVIAIGNNAAPRSNNVHEAQLAPLRFADDDAAAFHRFASSFAHHVALLTVLDASSQQRFPDAARVARPPTLTELRAVIADYRRMLLEDRRRGDQGDVFLFFSGHGVVGSDGAALVLLDGRLTREALYEEVLAALPARFIHLLVDACHAEAIVRPRDATPGASPDASGEIVGVSEADRKSWLATQTLERFPNVGAIIATSVDQQAHEWTVYQGGVFTHELLSGLRGAADVNGDRRVEYSELHAFLASANREVADPRAKLDVLVRVPPLDLRTPLVDLSSLRAAGFIEQRATEPFYLENERGERLLDAHAEPGHVMVAAVPANERLFYHTDDGEAELRVPAGATVRLERLHRTHGDLAARGAISSALERGLFVTAFGPLYYHGFADRTGEVHVTFPEPPARAPDRSRAPSVALWAVSGGLLISSAIAGGLALDARATYESTSLQRQAADARAHFDQDRIGFGITFGIGVAAAIVATAIYPFAPSHHHR